MVKEKVKGWVKDSYFISKEDALKVANAYTGEFNEKTKRVKEHGYYNGVQGMIYQLYTKKKT